VAVEFPSSNVIAPRLLSLLTLIEECLVNQDADVIKKKGSQRLVNFHKGLCRLTFAENAGAIVLQSYVLADGQSCLKAVLSWQGSSQITYESVYPQGNFDWLTAADRIATAWVSGPPLTSAKHLQAEAAENETSVERFATAG
jgi:hypothetical protein